MTLKDKIASAFDRQASAMAMIAEGVAELSAEQAVEVLRKALEIVQASSSSSAPPTSRGPRPTKRRRIHELVTKGYSTIDEIVSEMGISKAAVTNHLGVLVTAGKITRLPNGEFKEKK